MSKKKKSEWGRRGSSRRPGIHHTLHSAEKERVFASCTGGHEGQTGSEPAALDQNHTPEIFLFLLVRVSEFWVANKINVDY